MHVQLKIPPKRMWVLAISVKLRKRAKPCVRQEDVRCSMLRLGYHGTCPAYVYNRVCLVRNMDWIAVHIAHLISIVTQRTCFSFIETNLDNRLTYINTITIHQISLQARSVTFWMNAYTEIVKGLRTAKRAFLYCWCVKNSTHGY